MKGTQKDRSGESAVAGRKEDAGQRRDTRQDPKGDQGVQTSQAAQPVRMSKEPMGHIEANTVPNELMRVAFLLREAAKSATFGEQILVYAKEVERIAEAERHIKNPSQAYQQQKQRVGGPKVREGSQSVQQEGRLETRPGTKNASPPRECKSTAQGEMESGGKGTKSDFPPTIPPKTSPQTLPTTSKRSGVARPSVIPRKPGIGPSSTGHFSSPSSYNTESGDRSTEDASPSTGPSRGPILPKNRNRERNSSK